MLIIPAIDLKNGKCVRLLQGDPDKETIYSDDPVKQAKLFAEQGAKLIHVVDLDGAFDGKPKNMEIVKQIAKSLTVPIEVGGGIRNADTIEEYLTAGVKRIIIGTAAAESFFKDIIKNFAKYIIAGIDARGGKVATKGWLNVTDIDAVDLISEVMRSGVNEIIYTDIETDGMLSGPNYSSFDKILKKFPAISLIASGGISSIKDVRKLSTYSVKGCIIGKAIYDGRIDLKELLKDPVSN